MAEMTSTSVLNGFTYEIYDKLVDPIPESAKAVKEIPFKGGALELGNKLHVNVQVSDEGGFTHAASNTDAVTAETGISFESQDAQVDGFQINLQGSLSYEMAARASSSRKAFLEVVGKKLQNMVASSKRRLECEMWHGQNGIGDFDTAGSPSNGAVTLTCTLATFAPFVWQGKRNHTVVFYDTTTNAAISTYAFKVGAVTTGARTVSFTEINSGDATTLATAITSSGHTVRAFWKTTIDTSTTLTSPTWGTMAGIMKISANTTATLFNIDPTKYDVWQGNTYAAGGAMTIKKIIDAAGQLADRGAEGDLDVWLSNKTWGNIATDQAALRRYGAEVKEAKNGAKSIEFFYQDSTFRLRGHGMVKGGEGCITETDKWKRIGAQDFSFKTPGMINGQDIFFQDPTRLGVTWRLYGHQAVFCEMPSHQLYISGIVNN